MLRPEHQHSGLVQEGHLHGVPELRKWPLSQHKGQSAEAEPHHPVSHPSFAISSVAGRETKAETLNGIYLPATGFPESHWPFSRDMQMTVAHSVPGFLKLSTKFRAFFLPQLLHH